MSQIQDRRTETEVGEVLTQLIERDIPPDATRLAIAIGLSADEELDKFEIRGVINGNEVTLASAGSDFTTPKNPVLGASGDLTALAANTEGWVHLDCAALSRVSVWAASAAAVAAAGVLTATGNPTGGVLGTGTLTLSAVPAGAVPAAGVLTGTTIAAGDTVTIDGIVYTFVAALTMPASPNQVLVGATDSDSLDNLIAAINRGHGSSYVYSNSTVEHPTVVAAAGAGDTMDVTAKVRGTDGNSIATTASLTAGDFGAATLEDGAAADTVTIGTTVYTFDDDTAGLEDLPYHVLIGADADGTLDNLEAAINGAAGEGTTYGTGTVAHPLVSAENQGDDTLDITTLVQNGDTIATTETGDDTAWGAATVQSGVTADTLVLGEITYIFDAAGALIDEPNHVLVGGSASATLDNLIDAINGEDGAGEEGTVYGTGTVANALVSAAAGAGDTVDLTAETAGKAANSIAQDASGSSDLDFTTPMAGGTGPTTVTVDLQT